tara:strand:- start:4 stop:744 length:741 start_codon:yes stop_codon:yes gene_type:complete
MTMEFEELLYPSLEDVRSLQEKYCESSESDHLTKEEKDKLYDSQKDKDVRGEGKYKNDLQEGIWTEWYECKFRDKEDLQMLRSKALIAHVNKLIDEDSEYIKEEEDEDEDLKQFEIDMEFTSDDLLNFLMIQRRLREFNGCMKLVSNYVAGNKEYLSIGYGENDEVRFKCHYKNDRFDGLFTEWHENGKIQLECNYKDGKLDGHLTRWWDDGERMLDSDYIDGDLDGDEIFHNLGRGWTRTGPKSL